MNIVGQFTQAGVTTSNVGKSGALREMLENPAPSPTRLEEIMSEPQFLQPKVIPESSLKNGPWGF